MSENNEKSSPNRPDAPTGVTAATPVVDGNSPAAPVAVKPVAAKTAQAGQTGTQTKLSSSGVKEKSASPEAKPKAAARPANTKPATAKPLVEKTMSSQTAGTTSSEESAAAVAAKKASAAKKALASKTAVAAKTAKASSADSGEVAPRGDGETKNHIQAKPKAAPAKRAAPASKPPAPKAKPASKAGAEHKPGDHTSPVVQTVPGASPQVNSAGEMQTHAAKSQGSPAQPVQAAPRVQAATQASAVGEVATPVGADSAQTLLPDDRQGAESVASPTPVPQMTSDSEVIGETISATLESAPAPKTRSWLQQQLPYYIGLMRLDKPIGILLLLWPTLWALCLAAKGVPSLKNLLIFSMGVVVMRSAGCVINDFADRKIDGRVERTQGRPLATGAVSSREAIGLFITLCLVAFGLVLCTDWLTIKLSVGGLVLAFCYPFMKRHTHLPQVVLGAAFAWGIPMAYAAETGKLDKTMWLIYLAVVLWTVVYDTFYAMVDREDDLKIGVKSTAILFGEQDRVITASLQLMVLYALYLVGKAYTLGVWYYLGLIAAAGLFSYQQWLIRKRERQACFKAFLNNNWVGAAVFAGIALDLALK